MTPHRRDSLIFVGLWVVGVVALSSCSALKKRHAYDPFDRDALQSAELQLESMDQKKIRLSGGEKKEKGSEKLGPGTHVHLSEYVQHADVDGDGSKDAVGIAFVDSGGSGAFAELVTWLNRDGKPVPAPGVLLGDRVGLKGMKLSEGRAEVSLLVHGPEDPMCCPTQIEKRSYLWKRGKWEREAVLGKKKKR